MSGWTAALCVQCWNEMEPDRMVTGVHDSGPDERCSLCGEMTKSGIYRRMPPAEQKYPRTEERDA